MCPLTGYLMVRNQADPVQDAYKDVLQMRSKEMKRLWLQARPQQSGM